MRISQGEFVCVCVCVCECVWVFKYICVCVYTMCGVVAEASEVS